MKVEHDRLDFAWIASLVLSGGDETQEKKIAKV
jgi:hypothetical protein